MGSLDAAGTSGGWAELGAEAVERRVETPTLGRAHLLRTSHEGALVTNTQVPPPALVSANYSQLPPGLSLHFAHVQSIRA